MRIAALNSTATESHLSNVKGKSVHKKRKKKKKNEQIAPRQENETSPGELVTFLGNSKSTVNGQIMHRGIMKYACSSILARVRVRSLVTLSLRQANQYHVKARTITQRTATIGCSQETRLRR